VVDEQDVSPNGTAQMDEFSHPSWSAKIDDFGAWAPWEPTKGLIDFGAWAPWEPTKGLVMRI
jgi:hypothetical protein